LKRDKQKGPRSGAFLLPSLLRYCSGNLLRNHSGVDSRDTASNPSVGFTTAFARHGPLDVHKEPLMSDEAGHGTDLGAQDLLPSALIRAWPVIADTC
jgi:hypothetical protein